jgi:hypothetical protein
MFYEALGQLIGLEIMKQAVNLPSGCGKGVFSHCGGADHHPNESRDYQQLKGHRCRSIDHSWNFSQGPLEKNKNVGGTPGQACTLPANCMRQAALRRE